MTPAPARRAAARRVALAATAVVAAAAVVIVAGMLVTGGAPSGSAGSPAAAPGTAGPPAATGGGVALVPDLTPLALDGKVDERALAHDSGSDLYRVPFGAVPAGSLVRLRLRAAAGDLSDATIRIWDANLNTQVLVPMTVVATDRTGGAHGYDYWEATIHTLAQPTVISYWFIVRDGSTTRYLESSAAKDGTASAAMGAELGTVSAASSGSAWQIAVFKPDFTTPAWTRGAVVYQIFPDRFFNANPANDPSPTAQPTTTGNGRYRFGAVYGNAILQKGWTDTPEGYCRAYKGTTCTQAPLGRDFFGGDLAGITAKIDDLADLGVTVLYLSPIFAAPSNHRYDTADYRLIDPGLGTQQDFDALVAAAKAKGMRVILDGVFNHVSSASPYFDRYHQYSEVGACESAASPYRSWFVFRAPVGGEPSPCAPSKAGGTDTFYTSWAGFDTLPQLVPQAAVSDLFLGPAGVVAQWLHAGASGWRLDVMDNLTPGFLRALRSTVKAADANALILGEQWGDSTAWLLGSEADSTMNYRFRRAVIGLINGPTNDLDGAIAGLSPSQFAATMEKVREDYPSVAWNALLNLVDSHDTTRILWTLTPAAENAAAKEAPAALARGKELLRQLTTLQLTWPGMASVYYGDEVGLTGQDDPDDRRPYPWASRDEQLRAHYRTLARLRADHVALRDGDLRFLLADDASGALAFGRRTASEAAITVLNVSDHPSTATVPVADYLPDGTVLTDALGGAAASVANGSLAVTLAARGSAVFLTAAGTDLAPPAAPEPPTVASASGAVTVAWAPVVGATRYRILRSIVEDGGYTQVGSATNTTFIDRTARSGVTYHYAVVALDAAGNVGPRSADVTALPQLALTSARLVTAGTVEQPLSAVDAGVPMAGLVTVSGVTGRGAPTIGILAQLGFGAPGSNPSGNGWRWSETHWTAAQDGGDMIVGTVRPESPGSYDVVLRVSTDGGSTWAYAGRAGILDPHDPSQALKLTAVRGSDTTPPPVPDMPRVVVVDESSLTLAWSPVSAADFLRYRIWRAATPGGPYLQVGTSVEAGFTDDTIVAGSTYSYVVTSEDTSFNDSANSPEVTAVATSRQVLVTFRVTVPAGTPKDATIYVAGDFQGWRPGATAMTHAAGATWEFSARFAEGAAVQYKYTRGSWDAVEKDAGCGEIPNRALLVSYGADGTLVTRDAVQKWRDLGHCG
jgi:glycosidase